MREAARDQIETEWQFDAADLEQVEDWLKHLPPEGPVRVGPETTVRHGDTYFDTSDGRFFQAGFALRLRVRAGGGDFSLKELARPEGSLATRREITQHASEVNLSSILRIDGPVAQRVRLLANPEELAPVTEIRTVRTSLPLILQGGEEGEIALDRSALIDRLGSQLAFLTRVEVEVQPESVEAFRGFVHELTESCGLIPARESKFEWALHQIGEKPGQDPDLGPITVDASLSVGELAFAILRTHYASVLRHEPGTLLGENPDHLHDMRVAIRRMRAALRLFAGAFDPHEVSTLRAELQKIGSALGGVRDLDVQIEQMERWKEHVVTADPKALDPLIDLLRKNREAAREEMIRLLQSASYRRLRGFMIHRLQTGPDARTQAGAFPILVVGFALLENSRRKVIRDGKRIGLSSPPAEYHRLRIRCKRFRYALEFLEGVYGPSVRPTIRTLVELQDLLGLHQDAQVSIGALRALSENKVATLSPPSLLALGEVTQLCSAQAERMRQQFPSVFRRLRGRHWKQLKQDAMETTRKLAADLVQGDSPRSEP